SDIVALLVRRAHALQGVKSEEAAGRASSSQSPLGENYIAEPFQAFDVLKKANDKWKSGNKAGASQEAAYALSVLAFMQQTAMDTGDEIQSRALAVLAIARSLGVAETAEASCLLARSMGYCKEAADLAQNLPENHPIRLFLEHPATENASLAD